MTRGQSLRTGAGPARRGAGTLSLHYRPPHLDEEPAFRDDPIMGWVHPPEAPPEWHVLGSLLRPWAARA